MRRQAYVNHSVAVFTLFAMGGVSTYTALALDDAAAWIQCIWSIIAVFLAIIAPMWHAEAAAEVDYRRNRNLLSEIVRHSQKLCHAVAQDKRIANHSAPFYELFDVHEWEIARDSLGAFPVSLLRSAKELRDLMAVRAVMEKAVVWVRQTHSSLDPNVAASNIRLLLDRERQSFDRLRG